VRLTGAATLRFAASSAIRLQILSNLLRWLQTFALIDRVDWLSSMILGFLTQWQR